MGEIPWGFNRILQVQDKRVGGVDTGVGMRKPEQSSIQQEKVLIQVAPCGQKDAI